MIRKIEIVLLDPKGSKRFRFCPDEWPVVVEARTVTPTAAGTAICRAVEAERGGRP